MNMKPGNLAVSPAGAQNTREFFRFAGSYTVSPETSTENMASDAHCFLDSAEAMLNKLIGEFSADVSLEDQSMIFGIRHFVEMAKNLCEAVKTDLERARK